MGLVVLHGNRIETLRDITVAWLARQPLPPSDDEVVLAQSNGIAQWFKMGLARSQDSGGLGIAAGVQVELPSRFLWRTYRRVLGEAAVLEESPYAKHRLTWRLMRLLPALADGPAMAPVARYLEHDRDGRKRHAFAARVADLFDQYQVYRADWLSAWESGIDALPDPERGDGALPAESLWQPYLWRAIQQDMAAEGRGWERVHRGAVHAAFLQAIAIAPGAPPPGFPPRIVVFGLSSLPQQTLEALAALGAWSEVILAVMNPCRHYWAEIIEDRELLQATRRRQALKRDMPALPAYEELHQYAHPLLAAWGKQGRDFIRLLDRFDDPTEYAERFAANGARIDAFEAPDSNTVLARVQAAVLELEPGPELASVLPEGDASLQFSICHSAQREVEVLHDSLLSLFDEAHAAGRPLKPSDVIVMVPDIEAYAPVVEAVFGEIPPGDPRHVPVAIADRTARRADPLVRALEFVLRLPEAKLPLSEVLDFIDLPVVSRRLGLKPSQLPALRDWIQGAGVRWGLDHAHRAQLGLGAAGEQNSWWFGLRRMLLGYLAGDAAATDTIEPFVEVGGLEAEAVGALYTLLDRLRHHAAELRQPASPQRWGERLRAVLADFVEPKQDAELLVAERIAKALSDWIDACTDAAFSDPVDVAVVREAVLTGLDEVRLSQRFLGGGVMFATLMPMRAIPFEVVVLMGMNDGDYPRSRTPADFDLMALPKGHRPGDRSRRDDDRYLFLEALLSARRRLLISWCGRSVRDNTPRPPSVLVAQLRDYLDALYAGSDGKRASDALTTIHPLQPFSRRYAEGKAPTYRYEWLQLFGPRQAAQPLAPAGPAERLSEYDLGALLAHPVKLFFQRRLGVRLETGEDAAQDHEAFAVDGLGAYEAADGVLRRALQSSDRILDAALDDAMARLQRSGALPIGLAANDTLQSVRANAEAVATEVLRLRQEAPMKEPQPRIELRFGETRVELRDPGLRQCGDGSLVRLEWSPNSLVTASERSVAIKLHRLLRHWPAHVLAQFAGAPVTTHIVAPGGSVLLRPVELARAESLLSELVEAWQAALSAPLPLAPKTALAYASKAAEDPEKALKAARSAYTHSAHAPVPGEQTDPYSARAYPGFDELLEAGFLDWVRLYAPVVEYAGMAG